MAAVCSWIIACASAAAAEGSPNTEKLHSLLRDHAYILTVDDDGIGGPGREWLMERAGRSRFVLLGESHMTAEIPRITRGIWQSIHSLGFEHAAIETDPWTAGLIENKLRSGNENAYPDYVNAGNRWTIPFYTTVEETEFLRSVIGKSGSRSPALWGLDQIFNAGGVRVLKRLQELAATDRQREAVQAALESARENADFVGTAEGDELDALDEAFQGARGEAARLVSQLLLSHQIYGPFSRGEGSVYEANRLREQLMKRNFMDYYRHAMERRDRPPGVLLKFGAFHMFRGFTPTQVLGLGNFVTELATADGEQSLAVLIVCAGGRARTFRTGEAEPCQGLQPPSSFRERYPDDGYALFDLEALRPHHELWAFLPELLKKVIWSYDAMIVVPEATPATMPDGEKTPDSAGDGPA